MLALSNGIEEKDEYLWGSEERTVEGGGEEQKKKVLKSDDGKKKGVEQLIGCKREEGKEGGLSGVSGKKCIPKGGRIQTVRSGEEIKLLTRGHRGPQGD